ncbi:MAG TPA: polysaccharide deacetylase family protein [Gallionella sp.]|nr:polysaccharide deacetylase family protein [Gallionella sp.]
MKNRLFSFLLFACLLVPFAGAGAAEQPSISSGRTMAVTFDDLPFVLEYWPDVSTMRDWIGQLLQQINAGQVPVVGFVNEGKLYNQGQLDDAKVGLLKMWVDAGVELGNHTFSHASLNQAPLDIFEQDVIRGETVTKGLLEERGLHLRYFRYPFLQVGLTLEKRRAFEQFLAGRGYTVAPVTLNSSEWIFAAAYIKAWHQKDTQLMQRIADAYVPYMEQVVKQGEKMSVDLFGREIPQVLLVHANALNANQFGALVAMLKRRGYAFVTLAQAMQDPAYRSEDNYAGPDGESDLERWARAVGLRPPANPAVPAFVRQAAGLIAYTYGGY